MTLRGVLGVFWRHKWLMLGVLAVTLLALPLRLFTAPAEYSSSVKLLVTVPEQTNVELFGNYRSSTTADEINIARSNFVDVLKSDETRRRVVTALNLPEPLQNYDLNVSVSSASDFLTVKVTTIDAQWAAQIANEHVAQARQYFGEIRAQPAALAKLALAAQVSEATKKAADAEQALVDFKNQHQIASIDAEHNLRMTVLQRLYDQRYQAELAAAGGSLPAAFPDLLRSLDTQRANAVSRNENARATAIDEVTAYVSNQIVQFTQATDGQSAVQRLTAAISDLQAQKAAADQTGKNLTSDAYAFVIAYYSGQLLNLRQAAATLDVTNQAIADQEAKVAELNELTPQYTELDAQASQARTNLQTLANAYQEAVIKEDTALRADFMQVVLPASVQANPSKTSEITLIALGLAGSVAAAIALAFLAELLGRWLWPSEPAPRAAKTLERRHG